METAEKQVTDVVKVDIHLDYTPDGKRYIDKISEIIQLEEGTPYPEYDEEDATHSMNKITAEYYQRKTDRVGFKTHTILQYDLATHTYFTVDRFSPYLEEKIRKALGDELVDSFDEFMLKEWGPRAGTEEASMTQEQLDKRISDLHERIRTTEEEKLVAQTVPAYTLNENMTGEQIEEDAAERDLWKEGYSDGQPADIQNDFELGSFFSDDDYS